MLDLLIIVVSLAFFVAMIWFARACDVLQKVSVGMNTPLEYILIGIVVVLVTIYLVVALLKPEKF